MKLAEDRVKRDFDAKGDGHCGFTATLCSSVTLHTVLKTVKTLSSPMNLLIDL